jgi:hypothetical protein
MSKFISGKELTKRWDILPFQLLQYLLEGLQPYDGVHGMIIPEALRMPDNRQERSLWWVSKLQDQTAPDIWEDYIYLMNEKTKEQFILDLMDAYYMLHDVERIERQFHLPSQSTHQKNPGVMDRELEERLGSAHNDQTSKGKRINKNKDKDIVRAYAKGIIKGNPDLTRGDLAAQIKEAVPENANYSEETLIDWTRDLFPDYSPLKPGRKKRIPATH